MKNTRMLLMPLLLAVAVTSLLHGQALQPRLDGNLVRVAAPQLRFLTGRVLEKLHNGAAVPFLFQLSAGPDGRPAAQARARLVLSYDLWEEKFSVLQADAGNRAASHLTSSAAEAWCLESLSLPASALAGEKSFVLKLEIRAEETKDESAEAHPGLSLAGLIDVFSRKPKEEPLRWSAVSGPVRLDDLVRKKPNHH